MRSNARWQSSSVSIMTFGMSGLWKLQPCSSGSVPCNRQPSSPMCSKKCSLDWRKAIMAASRVGSEPFRVLMPLPYLPACRWICQFQRGGSPPGPAKPAGKRCGQHPLETSLRRRCVYIRASICHAEKVPKLPMSPGLTNDRSIIERRCVLIGPIAMDDRSQTKILGARVAASANPNWQTVWSGADGGSHPLEAAAMIAISNAVEAHINGVFVTFAGVKADIEAGEITTTDEIDAAFAILARPHQTAARRLRAASLCWAFSHGAGRGECLSWVQADYRNWHESDRACIFWRCQKS
jgi:hypothetical protein